MIELWRAQAFPTDADCGYVELHTVTEKELKQIRKGKPIRDEYRARPLDTDAHGYFTDYDNAQAALLLQVEARTQRAEHQARFAICHLADEKDFRQRTMEVFG